MLAVLLALAAVEDDADAKWLVKLGAAVAAVAPGTTTRDGQSSTTHTRTEPDFDGIADLAETVWVDVADRVGCLHTKKLTDTPRTCKTFF